jgi:GWxTD domain-containing protein
VLARSEDIEERRQAFEALNEAILLAGDDADLWIRMARLQLRRGFHQEARRAYDKALRLAPGRSDLWDELAGHEFHRFQRYQRDELLHKSEFATLRALGRDPRNSSALRRAVRIAYIKHDLPAVDSLCVIWHRAHPENPWPFLVRGMLYAEAGAWALAEESFEAGLGRMTMVEQKPFHTLEIVDPKLEEKRPYLADSTRFVQDFWKWQDPTPSDRENPRLLEYYRRMVQAELFFSLDDRGVRGWDHAPGRMVVRFGLPENWGYFDAVYRGPERRVSPTSTFSAPSIAVVYGRGIEPLIFRFLDFNLSGRYYHPVEPFPRVEDFLITAIPSYFRFPDHAVELEQTVEVWRFYDPQGTGRTEVAVALHPEDWPEGLLDDPHRLASRLTLYDEWWGVTDASVGSWARFERDVLGRVVGVFELAGMGDSLVVGLETTDRQKEAYASGYAALSPQPGGQAPLVSDIAFLTRVRFQETGGVYGRAYGNALPNPGHLYRVGDPIGIGFEAYGLAVDEGGSHRARLSITVGRRTKTGFFNVLLGIGRDEKEASLVFDLSERGSRLEQLLSIDIPPLDPGEYELQVTVDDLLSGRSHARTGHFQVLSPGRKR